MATLTDEEIEDNILMCNLTPMEAFTGRRVALIT